MPDPQPHRPTEDVRRLDDRNRPQRSAEKSDPSVADLAVHRLKGSEQAGVAPSPTTLEGLQLMLTIEEAAAVLRVSRTTAYKLADEWRTSHGQSGLRVVRLGRRLVVRRVDLAALVGLEPLG